MLIIFSQLFSHPLFITDPRAQPDVNSDKPWQKVPVAPRELGEFHNPWPQARTRMLHIEAKGFIQNREKVQLHAT